MNKENNEVEQFAWLYMLRDGEIREYSGVISWDPQYKNRLSNVTRGNAVFRTAGAVKKRFICTVAEGVTYQGKVWLSLPDKEKAIDILMTFEQQQIELAKQAQVRHEKRLDILKKLKNR